MSSRDCDRCGRYLAVDEQDRCWKCKAEVLTAALAVVKERLSAIDSELYSLVGRHGELAEAAKPFALYPSVTKPEQVARLRRAIWGDN